MIIETARFGTLDVEPRSVVCFQPGLLAFEELSEYALLDVAENPDFKWLQSLQDPSLAFLLVDPFVINPGYRVELQAEMMKRLHISQPEDVLIYTIVSVPAGGFREATTNLAAPLVINWQENKGSQLVLEKDDLVVRHPLFNKVA